MRSLYVVSLLVFSLGLTSSALAHPPDVLDLYYCPNGKVLSIQAFHGSKSETDHYVNKITVELNGKKIIEQKFNSQFDREHQEAVFKIIDAKIGDKFKVTAHCNISGKVSDTLTVKECEHDTEKGE